MSSPFVGGRVAGQRADAQIGDLNLDAQRTPGITQVSSPPATTPLTDAVTTATQIRPSGGVTP